MPYIDVEIDEFLDSCSKREIQQIINVLIKDGWINKSDTEPEDSKFRGSDEKIYEEALKKLHGKWNVLTKEEEEIILKISKRF